MTKEFCPGCMKSASRWPAVGLSHRRSPLRSAASRPSVRLGMTLMQLSVTNGKTRGVKKKMHKKATIETKHF